MLGDKLITSITMGVRPYTYSKLGLKFVTRTSEGSKKTKLKEMFLCAQASVLHGAAKKENVPCLVEFKSKLSTVSSLLLDIT